MTCYQPLKRSFYELTGAGLSVDLEDGRAELMGDGLAVIMQRDPTAKRQLMQNVVVSREDLEALQADNGALTIKLEDGEAHSMGEGCFVLMQRDYTRRGQPMQNVVVSANDTAAMVAAA